MNITKKDLIFGVVLAAFFFYLGTLFFMVYFSIPQNADSSWINVVNEAFDKFLEPKTFTISPFTFSKIAMKGGAIIAVIVLLIDLYIISGKKNLRMGEEHGSAKWGTSKDIAPYVDKKFKNNLLFTNTERITIETKLKKNKEYERNNNVVVVGGAGSGKTRFYVLPNLLQMHSSYVINDSKGGILSDTATIMQQNGYRIKVFNLNTMKNSDGYNPFHYIRRTEGDCEIDILKVVNNLMKNTSDPNKKGGDSFWDDAQRSFLAAIFHLLILKGKPEEQNLGIVADLVRRARVKEDDEEYISSIDLVFQELEQEQPSCFAAKQYQNFKMAAGKTAKSILISLGVRLSPFDVPDIRKLTSTDTLELDTIGDRKTVLYIILPDTHTTMNFLASMIYQQLFDTLVYKADNVYNGSLPIPVRCLLDEFANTGQIPDFENVIATTRSRGISVDVILQNLTQISKKLYKDSWETIIGNCDSFLYLGGNEQSTHKYISTQLGKETIDVVTYNESRGTTGSFTKNSQKQGRNLLDPNEVREIKGGKCIYMLRGTKPFLSDRFKLERHPLFKKLKETPSGYMYQSPLDQGEFIANNDPIDFELSKNVDMKEFLKHTEIETYDFEDEEIETINLDEL
ncbi:type IV secretory system conjugative DNA transfer family protein [Enterococcus faecium]|nr:type IV secretory system conjugative DNA transfer family protein [Enterococcus faecium]